MIFFIFLFNKLSYGDEALEYCKTLDPKYSCLFVTITNLTSNSLISHLNLGTSLIALFRFGSRNFAYKLRCFVYSKTHPIGLVKSLDGRVEQH
jgi:hypothetical protein